MINGYDLLRLGWEEGIELGKTLKKLQNMQKDGNDIKSILRTLKPPTKEKIEYKKERREIIETYHIDDEQNRENNNKVLSELLKFSKIPVVNKITSLLDCAPVNNSVPVGTVIETDGEIIPSAHGCDYYCSVMSTKISLKELNIKESDLDINKLSYALKSYTHFGPGKPIKDFNSEKIGSPNRFKNDISPYYVHDLGSLGDGNHFVHIGIDKGFVFLTTHFGSRRMGANLFKAITKRTNSIRNIKPVHRWVGKNSKYYTDYINALAYAESFTKNNHRFIRTLLLNNIFGWSNFSKLSNFIFSPHNFVKISNNKCHHYKGVTPLEMGSTSVIPINADCILWVTPKQDNTFLLAPHGAGRNVSRKEFVHKVKTNNTDTKSKCHMIWYGGHQDLSECPSAYKNPNEIKKFIKETCNIVHEIKGIVSIMAGVMSNTRAEITLRE